MPVLLPEAPDVEREADGDLRVRCSHGPVEDGTDVVVLDLETVEPAPLVGTRQLGRRPLDERDVPGRVACADTVAVTGGLELLGGIGPDRVEHPESGLAVWHLLDLEQALIHESHEAIEGVASDLRRQAAKRTRGGERHATRRPT